MGMRRADQTSKTVQSPQVVINFGNHLNEESTKVWTARLGTYG